MKTKWVSAIIAVSLMGSLLGGCGSSMTKNSNLEESSSTESTYDAAASTSQISTVYFNSSTVNAKQRMQIYTPAGYKESKETYPVLYLINGGGTDDTAWITGGNMQEILDELISEGKAKPMIVVMPDGGMNAVSEQSTDEVSSGTQQQQNNQQTGKANQNENNDDQANNSNQNGRGFWGGNSSENEAVAQKVDTKIAQATNDKRNQFIQELTSDIIPYITTNYRTIDDQKSRAIAGFSYGGAEALWSGVTHLDKFSWVGVFSMGIQGGSNANSQSIQGSGSSLTPTEFVASNKDFFADANTTNSKLKLFWIGVGKDDKIISNGAQQLSDTLKQYGIKYEYYESAGGHDMSNWQDYLSTFASKLFSE